MNAQLRVHSMNAQLRVHLMYAQLRVHSMYAQLRVNRVNAQLRVHTLALWNGCQGLVGTPLVGIPENSSSRNPIYAQSAPKMSPG